MGRDRDSGVKWGGIAGLRRKKDGKAGFENPYCGTLLLILSQIVFILIITIIIIIITIIIIKKPPFSLSKF